jgi:hypothetical protein
MNGISLTRTEKFYHRYDAPNPRTNSGRTPPTESGVRGTVQCYLGAVVREPFSYPEQYLRTLRQSTHEARQKEFGLTAPNWRSFRPVVEGYSNREIAEYFRSAKIRWRVTSTIFSTTQACLRD